MVGGHEPVSPVMRAVVRVGRCSGVLVRPNLVLTSAHCIENTIAEIRVLGQVHRVTGCEKDPGYKPLEPQHDLGLCRLAVATSMSVDVSVDRGSSELTIGDAVVLAGYGQSSAFVHDTEASLRVVDTSIVRTAHGTIQVGTVDHTACMGDSGGPVFIERAGAALSVVGIIHGPVGAICASPAEVTPLGAQTWLADKLNAEMGGRERPGQLPIVLVAVASVVFAAVLTLILRRVARRAPSAAATHARTTKTT